MRKNKKEDLSTILNKDMHISMEQIQKLVIKNDIQGFQLMVAIDFSNSNAYSGFQSYGGKNMHRMDNSPYVQCLSSLENALRFLPVSSISAYYFGDRESKDEAVFPLSRERQAYETFSQILEDYQSRLKEV